MATAGAFDIPARKDQSTEGARVAYAAIWSRNWPHDDSTLRELASEVPTQTKYCYGNSRCAHLLNAMRECDPH